MTGYQSRSAGAFWKPWKYWLRLPARSCLCGQADKAYYADINAMLLGKMSGRDGARTAEQLLERIIASRFSKSGRGRQAMKLAPIQWQKRSIAFQAYLSSQAYQGGVWQWTGELMTSIRAFFTGELFAKSHIQHKLFTPFNSVSS